MNQIKYLTTKIKEDIFNYRFLYLSLLILLLLLPNILNLFFASDLKGNPVMSISYIVLSLFIWLAVLSLVNLRIFFWVGLFFLLLSPIEIGFVKSIGMPINEGLMDAAFNTNINEVFEQIQSNLASVIALIVIITAYIFIYRKIKVKKISKLYRSLFLVSFFILNALLFMQMFRLSHTIPDFKNRMENSFDITVKKYTKIYPINLVLNSIYAWNTKQKIEKLNTQIQSFSFGAKQSNPIDDEEIHILIIGETARFHNFHINGYERETTPLLEKKENFISFQNVYSAANLTSISVPQIITRATPTNIERQFKEKSISEAFREAGYYSAWIGNQSQQNSFIKRITESSDYSYFSKSDVDAGNIYDTNTSEQLRKVFNTEKKKKFIVIHTLGSHFRYSNRYPDNFMKFRPTIKKTGYDNISMNYKNELINSYDNSILFTDFVISSIIDEVNKRNSISTVTYVSDHGENLYDDKNEVIFHGTENPTPYEYHIPYFIWVSQKFKETYPEKFKALQENKNKKASSTSTFQTLLDMADISYKNSEKEIYKSLGSSQYREPQERKLITPSGKIVTLK